LSATLLAEKQPLSIRRLFECLGPKNRTSCCKYEQMAKCRFIKRRSKTSKKSKINPIQLFLIRYL